MEKVERAVEIYPKPPPLPLPPAPPPASPPALKTLTASTTAHEQPAVAAVSAVLSAVVASPGTGNSDGIVSMDALVWYETSGGRRIQMVLHPLRC